jgi:2-polyprenyl-6-methoxyphenol hydroxylase-like FAD-dependent oxidoreductase
MLRPLIVGAGPVGLGAALFLAREGFHPRVVETRTEPNLQSRALAVNPRTLEILQPTGITERMLELGLPVRGAQFHRNGKILASFSFEGVHPKYPFLLALSQATTEHLLAQAFESAGGGIERGVKLVRCHPSAGFVEAVLEPSSGGAAELATCPWLLGADGARSIVRAQLGIAFQGSSLVRPWYLADAPLRTGLAEDRAHVFFLDDGAFLFLLRVVGEETRNQTGAPLWRILGNRPDPLSQLLEAEQTGPALWTSSFHISHRVAATLQSGDVYLAGDAAHIHSPLGARGMNLGLEDAWVFAHLAASNRLREYTALRHAVQLAVVRRIRFVSRVAAAEPPVLGLMRSLLFSTLSSFLPVRRRMMQILTGLDHDLPKFEPIQPDQR